VGYSSHVERGHAPPKETAMPITKTFVIEEHEEFGGLGLRPVDVPHADPLGGMATAHDMLEHFPGDDGGVEAELMALGATIFVRAEPGYFHNRIGNPDPAKNLAADFPEIARHDIHEGFGLRDPGRTCRVEDCAEGMITDAVREA